MNSIRFYVILLTLFLTTEIGAYRILGVIPLGYISHNILFQSLMKGLAKRGHQVDVISHFEPKDAPTNYTTILNLATLNMDAPKSVFSSIQESIDVFGDSLKTSQNLLGLDTCNLMSHERMQRIIKNPPNNPSYDLIIMEGLASSCYYAWGVIFKVPVVTLTPSMDLPWISYNIRNPLSTAFFPTLLQGKSEIKSFWDRLRNTVRANTDLSRFYSFTENQSEAMKKCLGPDIPDVREVERMVALSLVNTHYSLQGVRPLTPAFIEVAGLHIEGDNSSFTKELKEWMDKSKAGVVYITLGSTVPIETLPKKMLQAIYSSFAKLAPINVLMKSCDGFQFPPGLPNNVLTMPWIPQIPVLGHNNTKVFITHGGIHSILEALHFAVPIIGIPLFYDQHVNIGLLVDKKMGIQLDHNEITEQSLDEALMKILSEPKYREAAKYHSNIFRDRPMSATDTATFWIEYIIKNGAQSLRSPALDLYWWQVELLDVYGFLLFCFLIIIYLIFIIMRAIFQMFFGQNVKKDLKKE